MLMGREAKPTIIGRSDVFIKTEMETAPVMNKTLYVNAPLLPLLFLSLVILTTSVGTTSPSNGRVKSFIVTGMNFRRGTNCCKGYVLPLTTHL